MTKIMSGTGITVDEFEDISYDKDGNCCSEKNYAISIDEWGLQYQLTQIGYNDSGTNCVLYRNEYGNLQWKNVDELNLNPFDGDAELRQAHPSLEDAWEHLMEAYEEYQLAKKLVSDYVDTGK